MLTAKTGANYLLLMVLLGLCGFSYNLWTFQTDSIGLYDSKRIFLSSLIIINCLLLLFSPSLRDLVFSRILSIEKTTARLLLLLLLSATVTSLFFSLYFWRSQANLLYLLGLFLLTASLSLQMHSNRIKLYNYFYVITILLFLSVMTGHWIMTYYGHTPTYRSLIGFINPRFINQLQIWLTIPLLYLTLLNTKRKAAKNYWLSLTVLSLHVAVAIALDARGYILSISTAIIIWLIIDKKHRRTLLSETLKAGLLGIAIKALFLAPVPAWIIANPQDIANAAVLPELRTDSSLRLEHWSMLLELASFWGYGGDAYACNAYYLIARPHNSLLLVLFNWGVLATLSYSLLLLMLLIATTTAKQLSIKVTGLTLLAGFGYSFITASLGSPLSQLLAVVSLAFFWSSYARYQHQRKQHTHTSHSQKGYRHYILIITLFAVLGTVSYRLYNRIAHDHYREVASPLRPQFWLGNNCYGELPYVQLRTKTKPTQ